MNVAEGFSRVARMIGIVGWFILALSVIYAGVNVYQNYRGISSLDPIVGGAFMCAVAHGVAWIIKGFAKPKSA
ncbi:hypothetical protein [Paraburkholderia sp. SIMBA_054]|uniref:hypothetical protein n=1 Tax=Paraburkholderia sp. SIMBA_054 TaxID=3085795 RepID=UPI003979E777